MNKLSGILGSSSSVSVHWDENRPQIHSHASKLQSWRSVCLYHYTTQRRNRKEELANKDDQKRTSQRRSWMNLDSNCKILLTRMATINTLFGINLSKTVWHCNIKTNLRILIEAVYPKHGLWRARHSDWTENCLIMVVYENVYEKKNFEQKILAENFLIDSHQSEWLALHTPCKRE